MSAREDLAYEKIAAAEKKAGVPVTPKHETFFLPTKQDVKTARYFRDEWPITTPADTKPLAVAIRLVAAGTAVPLACLELVRKLESHTPAGLAAARKKGPD